MLHVAHIRDTYLRQTETFIYDIYKRHKGVRPFFFCEKTANLDQFPAENIVAIEDSGKVSAMKEDVTRRLVGGFPFYAKRAKKLGIELIHAHFGQTGYYALHAKREMNIPLITSFYGQDVFEVPATDKWKKRYEKLFSEGDLFLALSEDMKEDLVKRGCPEEKIRIYRLGIDLSDFNIFERPNRNRPVILTVARMVEKKGLEFLIKATTRLVIQQQLPVRLKIIGDGPLRPQLQSLASSLPGGEAVSFAGRMPFSKLPEEMRQADVFCLPSVTDRYGGKDEISMVLKEAMGTALPIVATIHAGIPEVIEDKVNGLLVPERDVDSLTEALKTLLADKALRKDIGMGGRRLVEKVWDINRQVDLLESIYHEVHGGA